ncbi:hypothetical protein [Lacibacter sp.]|uniref:hypothetical protein n=1 Tax=Lacibacter sp. TaxID=1915409 RepID=UPI002B4ABB8E|nr:hypothetical protein [Lacibacter sp.]HLP39069.1 hypothetical protein [Lacibacter sp.]
MLRIPKEKKQWSIKDIINSKPILSFEQAAKFNFITVGTFGKAVGVDFGGAVVSYQKNYVIL